MDQFDLFGNKIKGGEQPEKKKTVKSGTKKGSESFGKETNYRRC